MLDGAEVVEFRYRAERQMTVIRHGDGKATVYLHGGLDRGREVPLEPMEAAELSVAIEGTRRTVRARRPDRPRVVRIDSGEIEVVASNDGEPFTNTLRINARKRGEDDWDAVGATLDLDDTFEIDRLLRLLAPKALGKRAT